jgi:hypothetical protein
VRLETLACYRPAKAPVEYLTIKRDILCGVSYMYGKQSDNSSIGRLAIGAALIVGAANIFAYIQQAG